MKNKRLTWLVLFMILLSGIFIFMVKNVDVSPIGPLERVVGLSSLNSFFLELFGFNMFWYKVTNIPGILLDAAVVLVFFAIGIKQWTQRKSFSKVDRNILILGGTYIASFLIYVFFENFVINYRPIIVEGEKTLEPSFPSSHTLFAIVVMGTAIIECHRLIKNEKTRKIMDIFLYTVVFVTVIGRMISGVHWFTDIIGGILIGGTLVALYALSVEKNIEFDDRIKRFK